jgi:hypothetical protein
MLMLYVHSIFFRHRLIERASEDAFQMVLREAKRWPEFMEEEQ